MFVFLPNIFFFHAFFLFWSGEITLLNTVSVIMEVTVDQNSSASLFSLT